jgi:homoserine O-acetyltransferase
LCGGSAGIDCRHGHGTRTTTPIRHIRPAGAAVRTARAAAASAARWRHRATGRGLRILGAAERGAGQCGAAVYRPLAVGACRVFGAGRPIDTSRYFVVCVNSLGSPFGSSGPSSTDPRTGRPYGISFPEITVEDIATAGHEVVRSLGIERVAAVVGPSLGGMTVLAYCALFPGEAESLVTISGAARANPFAIALRSLQREMVRSDPAWRGGNYEPGRGPRLGMRLARKLGTITYRSAAEWDQRFGRRRVPETAGISGDFRPQFEVEAYLEHQAQRFSDAFDANAYLYLSRAMDQFDLAEHGGGSLAEAFARFGVRRALVLGVETDMLFPIEQQQEIADQLRAAGPAVQFHAFPSLQGHDAFLVDHERFEPAIRHFLADGGETG